MFTDTVTATVRRLCYLERSKPPIITRASKRSIQHGLDRKPLPFQPAGSSDVLLELIDGAKADLIVKAVALRTRPRSVQ